MVLIFVHIFPSITQNSFIRFMKHRNVLAFQWHQSREACWKLSETDNIRVIHVLKLDTFITAGFLYLHASGFLERFSLTVQIHLHLHLPFICLHLYGDSCKSVSGQRKNTIENKTNKNIGIRLWQTKLFCFKNQMWN